MRQLPRTAPRRARLVLKCQHSLSATWAIWSISLPKSGALASETRWACAWLTSSETLSDLASLRAYILCRYQKHYQKEAVIVTEFLSSDDTQCTRASSPPRECVKTSGRSAQSARRLIPPHHSFGARGVAGGHRGIKTSPTAPRRPKWSGPTAKQRKDLPRP